MRFAFPPYRVRLNPPVPARILFIKLSALGDVIQTLPTLEAIRAAWPRAEITWLVEEAAAPILAYHPALDTLLISRRRSWLAAWRQGEGRKAAWQEFHLLVRTLRRRPYDLVIDLQGLLKSAFWTSLARSPRKIGFDRTREYSYLALTERLPPYDPDEHAIRRYLRVAQHLGAASGAGALPAGPAGRDRPGPGICLDRKNRSPHRHAPRDPVAEQALAPGIFRGPGRCPHPGAAGPGGLYRQPGRPAFDLPYPVSHADARPTT